MIKHTAFLL